MSAPVRTPPITVAQAKELTGRIKRSAEELWRYLEEAYNRKAWQPLGYSSWRGYVEVEFRISEQRAYQLLDQAKVAGALMAASTPKKPDTSKDDGETQPRLSTGLAPVSERQARAMKPHLPEATDEIERRVEAGEDPVEVVDEVIDRYVGTKPRLAREDDLPAGPHGPSRLVPVPNPSEVSVADLLVELPNRFAKHDACLRSNAARQFGLFMDRRSDRGNWEAWEQHVDAVPADLEEATVAVAEMQAQNWARFADAIRRRARHLEMTR